MLTCSSFYGLLNPGRSRFLRNVDQLQQINDSGRSELCICLRAMIASNVPREPGSKVLARGSGGSLWSRNLRPDRELPDSMDARSRGSGAPLSGKRTRPVSPTSPPSAGRGAPIGRQLTVHAQRPEPGRKRRHLRALGVGGAFSSSTVIWGTAARGQARTVPGGHAAFTCGQLCGTAGSPRGPRTSCQEGRRSAPPRRSGRPRPWPEGRMGCLPPNRRRGDGLERLGILG